MDLSVGFIYFVTCTEFENQELLYIIPSFIAITYGKDAAKMLQKLGKILAHKL